MHRSNIFLTLRKVHHRGKSGKTCQTLLGARSDFHSSKWAESPKTRTPWPGSHSTPQGPKLTWNETKMTERSQPDRSSSWVAMWKKPTSGEMSLLAVKALFWWQPQQVPGPPQCKCYISKIRALFLLIERAISILASPWQTNGFSRRWDKKTMSRLSSRLNQSTPHSSAS